MAGKKLVKVDTGSAMVMARSNVQLVFAQVAELLNHDLEPDKLAVIFDSLKAWEKNVEDLNKVAKEKVKILVHETGEEVSDAGSRRLYAGDLVLEIRPSGGGPNAKRIEALIRAKGYDPATYMDSEVVYKYNEEKFKKLKLTKEERESCFNERVYAVQSPKLRGDE